MSYIIFSEKMDRVGNQLSRLLLKETFKEAIEIQRKPALNGLVDMYKKMKKGALNNFIFYLCPQLHFLH